MTKYDFELDMDSANSLSLIINKIENGTSVLEFGPAHGRMTRYLNEIKGCCVDIVEIDKESGRQATKYAHRALIGEIEGDIGNFKWLDILKDNRYDYIIFADVLEHLYNPWKVLKESKKILKDNGSIFVSIPNVAHNSVIIGLLSDNFKYNPVGLLDNTHIRFFTYNSLKEMISQADLVAVSERATYGRVGQIEIVENYEKIKNEALEYFLKGRKNGNVYQFVFELKKKEYYEEKDVLISKNIDGRLSDEAILYIKEENDNEYAEQKTIRKPIYAGKIEIDSSLEEFKKIEEIRLDPTNKKCIIHLIDAETEGERGKEKLYVKDSNASVALENNFIFLNVDPQIIFEMGGKDYKKLKINYEVFFCSEELLQEIYMVINKMFVQLKEKESMYEQNMASINDDMLLEKEQSLKLSKQLEEIKFELENQRNLVSEEEKKNKNLTMLIQDKKEENEQQRKEIEQQRKEIEQQRKEIEQRHIENGEKEKLLKEIYSSRGWKYLSFFKKIIGK